MQLCRVVLDQEPSASVYRHCRFGWIGANRKEGLDQSWIRNIDTPIPTRNLNATDFQNDPCVVDTSRDAQTDSQFSVLSPDTQGCAYIRRHRRADTVNRVPVLGEGLCLPRSEI